MPSTTRVSQLLAERQKAIASAVAAALVWFLLHVVHVADISATYQVLITGVASTVAAYVVRNAPRLYDHLRKDMQMEMDT